MSDKSKNLSDIDNFWDLNSLLPQKRPVMPSNRAVNTDTVELEFSAGSSSDSGAAIPPRIPDAIRSSNTPKAEQGHATGIPSSRLAQENRSRPLEPYLIYSPENRLIHRVGVSKWQTRYNFYEKFREDARRYWDRKPSECEAVNFFSYIPQYNQLKYAQLKWYIFWRDNVRRGIYPHTDFSYILLYIFEIINCPDLIEPKEGIELLCDIWLNYRAQHRRIDSYLSEWLCDYCLIHKLPCPIKKLEPILVEVVSNSEFKEFYMDSDNGLSSAASILAYSSIYNWRNSRYVTKENIGIFSKHIKSAFDKAYVEVLSQKFDEIAAKEAHIERDAYNGALCAYDMKRTLSIDYISYARSPKFRFVVTDIIKYSENRVRMALGIKARLKTDALSDVLKACIDEYFDANLPIPNKVGSKARAEEYQSPEYEKLYEPTSKEFSLDNALKIEKDSWNTTAVLTAMLSDEDERANEPIGHVDAPPKQIAAENEVAPQMLGEGEANEFYELIKALDDASCEALKLVAGGDGMGVERVARREGMLVDALADKINETAFDIIGDSIIEADGSCYRLINEYEGELSKWLK